MCGEGQHWARVSRARAWRDECTPRIPTSMGVVLYNNEFRAAQSRHSSHKISCGCWVLPPPCLTSVCTTAVTSLCYYRTTRRPMLRALPMRHLTMLCSSRPAMSGSNCTVETGHDGTRCGHAAWKRACVGGAPQVSRRRHILVRGGFCGSSLYTHETRQLVTQPDAPGAVVSHLLLADRDLIERLQADVPHRLLARRHSALGQAGHTF